MQVMEPSLLFSSLGWAVQLSISNKAFGRTIVLCMLVVFHSWCKIFLEPLSENLRVHPSITIRLVTNDRKCIHVYILKTSWLRKFSNHNWFK